MQSFHQLLAAHAPLLVLDAASSRVQVGWLTGACAAEARWATADEEAGSGVFHCIEQLGIDPLAAGGWVFCDGPGSILGIRTVSMALRTWRVLANRPAFAYGSLALVAESIGDKELTVIADARRQLWHAFRLGGDKLARVPATELGGQLATPEHFRHWTPLPVGVDRVPYSVASMLSQVPDSKLFRPSDAPDAFLHEEPSYAMWIPHIHRGPCEK